MKEFLMFFVTESLLQTYSRKKEEKKGRILKREQSPFMYCFRTVSVLGREMFFRISLNRFKNKVFFIYVNS